MGYNFNSQPYDKYSLRLVDRDYSSKRAKEYEVIGYNMTVWIPDFHLMSDGTLKEGRNLDSFLKNVRKCKPKRPDNYLTKTNKEHLCKGCGCRLPKGAEVNSREIAEYGEHRKVYWCNRCWAIMRSCMLKEKVGYQTEQDVRKYCKECQSYPLCDKVDYLREEPVGAIYWGNHKD